MALSTRCAAIYAGLLGAWGIAQPTPAMALSLEALTTDAMAPYVHFTLGCVAGAALSTAVHMSVAAWSATRRERALEKDVSPIRQVMAMNEEAPAAPQEAHDEARPKAVSRSAARHMAARDWEASGVIRVQEVASATPAAQPATQEPKATQKQEGHGAHTATDYGDIAENYVRRKGLRERMATGVAGVLASRLGANPFDGLPIIERADGTVGDVGTSWWNDALGSSIRRIDDLPKEALEPVADSTGVPFESPAARFDRSAEASQRASYISRNVAEVNVGIYPEHRNASELDREDIWEMALQAMDERLAQQSAPVFSDAIGAIETIDEPDGLEGSTGFIPFRMPAGHPEVVDTNSYVDYLIGDEFSRNPSQSARKSSHDFLTVIQGGSQKMRPLSKAETGSYQPRHFAPVAKEA